MHDYILSCCSAADVTQEKLDAMDVSLLCNDFSMDGVPYKDDLGKTMTYEKQRFQKFHRFLSIRRDALLRI